jgi:hypothetical protein
LRQESRTLRPIDWPGAGHSEESGLLVIATGFSGQMQSTGNAGHLRQVTDTTPGVTGQISRKNGTESAAFPDGNSCMLLI